MNIQQVDVKLFYKKDSQFRQFFKVPRIDWCLLMSGDKKPNGLLKSLMETFKETCPQLVQKCPYVGRYEISDLKMRGVLLFYPAGIYRVDVKAVENAATKNTLSFSLFVQIFN